MIIPEPANAACFSDPRWRLRATGFDTEFWFNNGQVRSNGGIPVPKEIKLLVGQRYYRFASSTSSRDAQIGSGWWLTYESFRQIREFARTHGYSLSESARLHLALPYSWTRVDRLVSAILAVPLRAYAGRGGVAHGGVADARDADAKWIPLQHREVMQLYIPGLFVKGASEQLYTRAFPNPVLELTFPPAEAQLR